MRKAAVLLGLVLASTALAFPAAQAAGTPVIESPTVGAAHYNGFTGPFVVNFEDAPRGTYDYYVDMVEAVGAVPAGAKTFVWKGVGSFPRPELRVAPLKPATGYYFHVTDAAGDQATLRFDVKPGPPPTCSIRMPTRVRMTTRSFLVRATLSPQCAALHTVYAVWQATKPRGGFAETFTFDHTSTDSWRIFDDEQTGTYPVRAVKARDSSPGPVPQNATQVTMRMDARIRLTSSRRGAFVTLRTASTRYSPVANRYVAWGGRTVVLSSRACSRCAWKPVRTKVGDRHGRTSYRFRASGTRQYRAAAYGTATTWAPRASYSTR